MNWSELLTIVLKLFIIPVLGIALKTLVSFIHAKCAELIAHTDSEVLKKYLSMAESTVTACVIATNQTFVEPLKQQGKFDKAAQLEAFKQTKEAVLHILSEDVKSYLVEAVGDIDVYLNSLIEAQVNTNKILMIKE